MAHGIDHAAEAGEVLRPTLEIPELADGGWEHRIRPGEWLPEGNGHDLGPVPGREGKPSLILMVEGDKGAAVGEIVPAINFPDIQDGVVVIRFA